MTMKRLSIYYAIACSLLAEAFQQSSTFSAQRQRERITQNWKTSIEATRRPAPAYWEEEEELYSPRRPAPRDGNSELRRRPSDDYYYEDYYDEEGGNYWSNPPARYDPVRSPEPRGRVPRPDEPPRVRSRPSPRRPSPSAGESRRKTFRSGTPPPPPLVGEFYNQMFWYGVDPGDSYDPPDKTMFGGTKGKFNGLAFLLDEKLDFRGPPGKPPPENFQRARQRPYYEEAPPRRSPSNYYEDDGDVPYSRGRRDRVPPYTARTRVEQNIRPEYWEETPAQKMIRKRRSSGGQSLWQGGDVMNQSNIPARKPRDAPGGDWAAEKVANWFRDDGDEYYGERPRGGARKSWAPAKDVFSTFLGVDKEEMRREAEMYNQNMGIGSKRDNAAAERSRDNEKRKGYAYRYEADKQDDSDDSLIVDADVIVSDVDDAKENFVSEGKDSKEFKSESKTNEPARVKEESKVESSNESSEKEKRPNIPKPEQNKQQSWHAEKDSYDEPREQPSREAKSSRDERSTSDRRRAADNWEQRALARERIPPKVPAWGPNGDLGMDAQEKAYLDAVQEVSDAEVRLEQRKKQLEDAEENIEILKFDIKREKRRIARNPQDERMLKEDIRSMELDLHDAELLKRKAQDRVRLAENRLASLKDWYGSLLSLYNHSQAKAGVNEALREFHQNEPAARNLNRAMPSYMQTQGTNSEKFGIQRPDLPY